jgi:hypothetical protein
MLLLRQLPFFFGRYLDNLKLRQGTNETAQKYFKYVMGLFRKVVRSIPPKEEFTILNRLMQDISAGESSGNLSSHLRDRIAQFLEKINGFKDEKLSASIGELLRAIFAIEDEVAHLRTYSQQIEAWPQHPELQIASLSERANAFLHGRPGIKGIITDFEDQIVEKAVDESDFSRKLLNYPKLIGACRVRRDQINRGLHEGSWAHFLSFFDQLKPFAESLIGFGYPEYAKIIDSARKNEEEYGKAPLKWLALINRILNQVTDPKYVVDNVIVPASRELSEIFEKRIEELRIERTDAINRLKKRIDRRLTKLADINYTIKKVVVRILDKEKSKLASKWDKARRVYSGIEDPYILVLLTFSEGFAEVEPKLNIGIRLQLQDRVRVQIDKHLNYVESAAGSSSYLKALRDIDRAVGIIAAEETVDRLTGSWNDHEQNLTQVNEDTIRKVESINRLGQELFDRAGKITQFIQNLQDEFLIGFHELQVSAANEMVSPGIQRASSDQVPESKEAGGNNG